MENTYDLILEINNTGHCQYVSPNCYAVLGYDSTDMLGKSFFDFVHPEERQALLESFHTHIGLLQEIDMMCRLQTKHNNTMQHARWLRTGFRFAKRKSWCGGCWRAMVRLTSRQLLRSHRMTVIFSAWKEMIENITANGGPDLSHSLNFLALPGDPIKVTSADQLKDDVFSRFIGTFQEFFDGAQHVETEFAG